MQVVQLLIRAFHVVSHRKWAARAAPQNLLRLLLASPLPVLLKQVVRDINERQARELTDAADEARRLKEQVGAADWM